MIESIRLTETDKELLVRIKRKTGIESWNILCRWSYLIGLSHDQINISNSHEKRDAIEIKWETFAGRQSSYYEAITKLKYTSYLKNNNEGTIFEFFHTKLSFGIRILSKSASEEDLLCFSKILDLDR
jgi:DNA sulfur modification protein DndE